jgi:hypothetical protein
MTRRALADFADEALLPFRRMIGLVFFTSAWKHATDSQTLSKHMEMSKGFARFLGTVECAGTLGVLAVGSHA